MADDDVAGIHGLDGVHGVPSARLLVEAVREFLERDVLAAIDGRVQFHTRVAVNVLGMVERELATGADHAARHRQGLASLGFDDEAGLAAAIRKGELDDRLDDVVAFVTAMVRARLEVANPRYLETP